MIFTAKQKELPTPGRVFSGSESVFYMNSMLPFILGTQECFINVISLVFTAPHLFKQMSSCLQNSPWDLKTIGSVWRRCNTVLKPGQPSQSHSLCEFFCESVRLSKSWRQSGIEGGRANKAISDPNQDGFVGSALEREQSFHTELPKGIPLALLTRCLWLPDGLSGEGCQGQVWVLARIGDVSPGDLTGGFKPYVPHVALLAADQPWLHIGISWRAV